MLKIYFCSFPSGKKGHKKSHDSALQWCVWTHRGLQQYFLWSSLAFSSSFSLICFPDPCQDPHSRPHHDSFICEYHTESSMSKSPLTQTVISSSKTCLFILVCSLKNHSQDQNSILYSLLAIPKLNLLAGSSPFQKLISNAEWQMLVWEEQEVTCIHKSWVTSWNLVLHYRISYLSSMWEWRSGRTIPTSNRYTGRWHPTNLWRDQKTGMLIKPIIFCTNEINWLMPSYKLTLLCSALLIILIHFWVAKL